MAPVPTRQPCLTCVSQIMMTSSNGNIFRVTGPSCGEFTGHWWIPHTKASDAELLFFYVRLNKRLSKQSWGWWFEMPSHPIWRHCSVNGTSPYHTALFVMCLSNYPSIMLQQGLPRHAMISNVIDPLHTHHIIFDGKGGVIFAYSFCV